MTYSPHTNADRAAMLAIIGVENIEALFASVPERVRFPALDLPGPAAEMEAAREAAVLADDNADAEHYPIFLGAGAYNHYRPPLIDYLIQRGEFLTAYTPYQPEVSQGTLQAIYEYQSLICALTGMEAANASHYDGATALAEAVIMAWRQHHGRRKKIIMAPFVHPQYRAVVRTYTQGLDMTITGDADPRIGLPELLQMLDGDTAILVLQSPDFLGRLEPLAGIAERVHAAGAWLAIVADPITLGLFKPPGELGADVAVGEGQPLGLPPAYGGPYLGFFATRRAYIHKMPGRLVGETHDRQGRRGYVLTLAAREQHIKRGKATSNICTNQSLMALAAAIYLAALGRQGLRRVAELCWHKSHYAAQRLAAVPGFRVEISRPFFREFVMRCPMPVADLNRYLFDEWGIIGGYDLGQDYPHLERHMLVCVTEMNSRAEIDELAEALREARKSL